MKHVHNNVATWLETNDSNVQWDQFNRIPQEKPNEGPPLQKTLSLNIYNREVLKYIKQNLQQAAGWVWNDPDRRSRYRFFD